MSTKTVHIDAPNWFVEQWYLRRERVWLGAILALALGLRVVRLGSRAYWHDEVHTLFKSENLAEVFRGEYVSNHPPLFETLLWAWRSAGFGQNQWTTRMLPVLLGLGGVVAIYLAGKRLLGTRTGLFAAFLLAIAPLHVYHSQDLKLYVLVPFTCTLAVYFLYRAAEEGGPANWLWYCVTAALAMYSDFFSGPLLLAANGYFIIQNYGKWRRFWPWLTANFLAAAAFLAYARVFLDKTSTVVGKLPNWWVPEPTWTSPLFFFKAIAFGYSGTKPYYLLATALFALAAAAGTAAAWHRRKRAAAYLLTWFFVPLGLVLVISLAGNSIFLIRAMMPYAIAVYILVAAAIAALPWQAARAASLAVFAAVAALPLYEQAQGIFHPHEFPHRPGIHRPREYDEAAALVRSHWEDGDILVHACASTWVPFYWYGFREPGEQRLGMATRADAEFLTGSHVVTTARDEYRGYYPGDLQTIVEGKDRVWFVFAHWERHSLQFNPLMCWLWLSAHYNEVGHYFFTDMEVFLFENRRAGEPIVPVERAEDDGVQARVRYRGGLSATYVLQKPDPGLVARPVAERRGALRLRFSDEVGDAPPHVLEPARAGVATAFELENTSDAEVSCVAEAVVSDVLVPLTELKESRLEPDLWTITKRHNLEPPPPDYFEPIWTARLTPDLPPEALDAALTGTVALPPGTYTTRVNLCGSPLEASSRRGGLTLTVGGTDVAAVLPRNDVRYIDWQWFAGAPLEVEDDEPLPINLTASPAPGVEQSWVNAAYLALRRVPYAAREPDQAVITKWPGDVRIPAQGKQVWSVEVPADAARLDVWVRERGPHGKVYHIFRRRWTPGTARGEHEE